MRILILLRMMHSNEEICLILNIHGVNIMSNIEMIKKQAASAEEMARNLWLAGLGAYGKGYEEVKGRFESLSTDSNKLFAELVEKGEKIETEGKAKVEEVKTKVSEKAEIETRVETVRNKLGLNSSDTELKIEELNAKIDALTEAVAKLAAKPAATKA